MKIVSAVAALGLLSGLAALPAAPALAQNQRIIEVFGNDPCPSSNGEEVVVCNRKPERERFRIPETLRTTEVERGAQNRGVALADSIREASSSSLPDNCSPAGGAGQTGCWRKQAQAARAERRQSGQPVNVVGGAVRGVIEDDE
jgi:hypothetical protein